MQPLFAQSLLLELKQLYFCARDPSPPWVEARSEGDDEPFFVLAVISVRESCKLGSAFGLGCFRDFEPLGLGFFLSLLDLEGLAIRLLFPTVRFG